MAWRLVLSRLVAVRHSTAQQRTRSSFFVSIGLLTLTTYHAYVRRCVDSTARLSTRVPIPVPVPCVCVCVGLGRKRGKQDRDRYRDVAYYVRCTLAMHRDHHPPIHPSVHPPEHIYRVQHPSLHTHETRRESCKLRLKTANCAYRHPKETNKETKKGYQNQTRAVKRSVHAKKRKGGQKRRLRLRPRGIYV